VHLTLRGEEKGEFQDLLRGARVDPRGETYKFQLLEYALRAHRSLLIHEWAHVFQLATYPALLLRSARAGRVMNGLASYLAQNPGHHPLPLNPQMDEAWRASRMIGTLAFRVSVEKTGVRFTPEIDNPVSRGMLTERDLLEEDATVMQYRAEIGGHGNGAAYRNWLWEKPRYTRLFSFLSAHLGEDAAFRLLPILVRCAYRTTRPLTGFMTSLATLMHEGPALYDDREQDGTLEEVLLSDLKTKLGHVEPDALDMQVPELDDPKGVIDEAGMEQLAQRHMHLPASLLTHIDLHGADDQRGVARKAMREPWAFFKRGEDDYDPRLFDFLPPAIVISLDDPSFPAGSTLLLISPFFAKTPFPTTPEFSYADWLNPMLKSRLLSNSLKGTAGANSRCPHAECAYHASGLCEGWMTVPSAAVECEFPEFFTRSTKHRLSSDGVALVPVPTEEG
jgi:hypothetical protein